MQLWVLGPSLHELLPKLTAPPCSSSQIRQASRLEHSISEWSHTSSLR